MLPYDIVLFPIYYDLGYGFIWIFFIGLLGLLVTLILLGFSIYKQIKSKQYYPYLTSLLCVGIILPIAVSHLYNYVDITCYFIIVYFIMICTCIYFSYRNRDKHIAYFLPPINWISTWMYFIGGEFIGGV